MSRLLSSWQTNETAAIDRIYREMFPGLCAFARRTLGPVPGAQVDSEDVVQSALGSLCRYMRSLSGPMNKTRNDIWKLLFRIVERKARRRRTRQTRGLGGGKLRTITDLEDPQKPFQFEELLGSVTPREFDVTLSEVLENLTPLEARIVMLALEDYTREEIGQQLGFSKRSILRKMDIIRKKLAGLVD